MDITKLTDSGKIDLGLTFHIPWWQFSDAEGKKLIELASGIKPKIIYEIGCWTGHSTSYLAQIAQITDGCVHAIDSFHGTRGFMQNNINDDFDARKEFEKNMNILGLLEWIKILHGYSYMFVPGIEDESIDMIFIDGNHSYEGIKRDIDDWWPKIRKGGLFCGHDCEIKEWDEDKINIEQGFCGIHHGVIKAVFEKFPNAKIELSKIWWVIKDE